MKNSNVFNEIVNYICISSYVSNIFFFYKILRDAADISHVDENANTNTDMCIINQLLLVTGNE